MWWHKRRNQISSFGETDRVHLNQRGRQFSRLLAAEVCASAVVMLDAPCSEVVWRVLATHPIRQFTLHFPSRASPCAITFQLESTKGGPKDTTDFSQNTLRKGTVSTRPDIDGTKIDLKRNEEKMWTGYVTFKIGSNRECDQRTQDRHSPLYREITKHPISHFCQSPFSSKVHKSHTPVRCCDYNYSLDFKFSPCSAYIVFFSVFPWRLNYICRRFGTLYLFHLHRPMKMEQIECSETSAYINQTPGNYPKENIIYNYSDA